MQPKLEKVFVCGNCGNERPKWEGRCSACDSWNSFSETVVDRSGSSSSITTAARQNPQELSSISTDDHPRLALSSKEMNRVLGGGIVPGTVALLAGDPGIGKSTMLLRLAADVAHDSGPALYVSGEESPSQLKMRADRMALHGNGLHILHTSELDDIVAIVEQNPFVLVVVDSIQTVQTASISSGAGSIAQIKECARILIHLAKTKGIPMLFTGHVTKGGDIAGPKVLEHLVDVVLYLEGDQINAWRIVRAVKNRFGSTNEVGVFEMVERGLIDVDDPSGALLSERARGAVGSTIVPVIEGTRPLLIEVQALTSPTSLPSPRRVATGIDTNRLLLVCAVLSRRLGVRLADQDVLVNVAGGLRISEPAADLGVALSIISSMRDTAVYGRLAAFGEIGLSGELRRVSHTRSRVYEAERLGFSKCILPSKPDGSWSLGPDTRIALRPVGTVAEAVAFSLGKDRPTGVLQRRVDWPEPRMRPSDIHE